MATVERMECVYTSYEGLLAALANNAKALRTARATPNLNRHVGYLRDRRSLLLTVLGANRIEARRLLDECNIQT